MDSRREAVARALAKQANDDPDRLVYDMHPDEGPTPLGTMLEMHWLPAADAALAAADAQGWRPISEAQHIRERVDIVDLWACGERVTDCTWGKPTYGSEKSWIKINGGYDCDGPIDEPVAGVTHFRHLPPPPEGEGQ